MNKPLKLIISSSLLIIGMNQAFAIEQKELTSTAPIIKKAEVNNKDANHQKIVLPKEFFTSCQGKAEGNACEFLLTPTDKEKRKGMCSILKPGMPMGCKPTPLKKPLPSPLAQKDVKELENAKVSVTQTLTPPEKPVAKATDIKPASKVEPVKSK